MVERYPGQAGETPEAVRAQRQAWSLALLEGLASDTPRAGVLRVLQAMSGQALV
jgi:hypothetical protein